MVLIIVGSSIKECIPNSKLKVLSPVDKCWVESRFCAYLVLRYDDPENPQLEAMNSVRINDTMHIVQCGFGKGIVVKSLLKV